MSVSRRVTAVQRDALGAAAEILSLCMHAGGRVTPSERPWLASYPEHVAPDIVLHSQDNIVALMMAACTRYASRTAYRSMGHELTYHRLEQHSRAFAAWLQSQGTEPGTRVALMLPNVLQYPIALFGALRAGCVVVNCNPLYTPRELEFQLNDAGAQVLVVLENFAHTVAQVQVPSLKRIVLASVGELLGAKGVLVNFVLHHVQHAVAVTDLPGAVKFKQTLHQGEDLTLDPPPLCADTLAFLQYTGGTTGRSKGAMLTHGNLVANLTQVDQWMEGVVVPGQEIIVTALPLYHVFALTANCLTFLHQGATNLLIINPRDLNALVKDMGSLRFTVLTGVNTLFNALLNHPDFARLDFSGLKITLGGGMAVQREVAQRWQSVTGCTLTQAYGLTETSPAATINPLSLNQFNGSIGLPLPSTIVSIRDDAGQLLPQEQAGEICVQGPQVMSGYWNQPEETAAVFYPDGALRTGDIGRMDAQGFVYVMDRKKDMIKVSGFNVYPNEVEEILSRHSGILEAAAIGVPDEHSGEAIKVFVVRKDPQLTEAQLLAFCHQHLTGYKVPRHVEFRDELPHSNVGKILRRALKE